VEKDGKMRSSRCKIPSPKKITSKEGMSGNQQ